MNRRSTNGPTYAFSDRLNLGHSHIHSSSMDSSRMVRSTFSQLLRLSVLAACIISCTAAPVSTDTQAMIYLSQFGYLNPSARNPASGHIIDENSWTNAILEFQNFAGINETGELDDETTRWMSLPRCGVKDKVGFDTDSRSKRYALQGSRWRVKDLLYRISKYPRNLPRAEVDLEVAKSFEVWTKYTDLTFTPKKTGQVHIEIRFEKGEHGDGDPFDGPGGTLAHAYFPVYGGDAHFDDAETWTTNSYTGTNLFQVAAHEIGHALGLSHSDTKSALMAPFYRGYDPSFSLNSDDVQGIQALYGKKTTPDVPGSSGGSGGSGPPAPPQPGRADERLCADSKFDTIFNSDQGATYAFKGDYYWKLADDGIAPNYPRPISKSWIGLPGNIDAAFTYKNGKTYFFKGTKYWRYQGKRMDGEYPKDISDGFTGIPDNVDASLVWSGNGKIYFFKGSKFWRFDPSQRPPVKATYPKPISNWEGVPNNLDAAFQYTNGYSYFFKDGTYYRFNDRTFSVDAADPAFPRSTAYWWFGCKSSPSGTVGGKAKLDLPAEEQDGEPSDGSDLVLDAVGSDERGPERPDNGSSSSKPANATIFFTLLVVYLTIRKMAAI